MNALPVKGRVDLRVQALHAAVQVALANKESMYQVRSDEVIAIAGKFETWLERPVSPQDRVG